MKQNISITRARTKRFKLYVTDASGSNRTLSTGERLIFGVKKALTDSDYTISKTVEYQAGFEQVIDSSAPTWEANKYYSKSTSGGVDTYTLTTSEPVNWSTTYSNYYVNNGLYSINLEPSDTESLVPNVAYFYDVGLESGVAYYSIIDTSKFYLVGNVTKKGAQ